MELNCSWACSNSGGGYNEPKDDNDFRHVLLSSKKSKKPPMMDILSGMKFKSSHESQGESTVLNM